MERQQTVNPHYIPRLFTLSCCYQRCSLDSDRMQMTHFLFYNHDVTQSECAHRLVQDIQMLWYDWCEIHALMRQSDWCEIQTLMRLPDWCEIHTLMPRSDWCEQHTTLYANIEFFFLWKEKTQKSISSQTKWSLLYWPCRRRLSDVLAMAIRSFRSYVSIAQPNKAYEVTL